MKYLHIVSFSALLALAACQTASNGKPDVDTLISDKSSSAENTETASNNSNAATGSAKAPEPDVIQSYAVPKTGTVYTWKNNWANLPEIISYKVAGTVKLGSSEYVKFTSLKGFKSTTHAFYDTSNFSLKGYRDKADKALVTFKPTEERYKFPMGPGSKWLTNWKQLDHKSGRVTSGGGVVTALRWENLQLPAGKIRALKVKMPVQKGAPKGLTHHVWFSPEHGVTVKEEIGGGLLNWSQVLQKIETPK